MNISWNKIGFKEINELLSNQNEFVIDKQINITITNSVNEDSRENENVFDGEIDQVFLSYAMLLIKKYNGLKINIQFSNPLTSNRLFSFSNQLNHIKHLYSNIITNDIFTLSGS